MSEDKAKKEYILIRNWERFQHYKERHPIWIKVYVDLLNDDAFVTLSDPIKYLYVALLIASARTNGIILNDWKYIRKVCAIRSKRLDITSLFASGLIAKCYQDDPALIARRNHFDSDTRARTRSRETEKRREDPPKPPASGGLENSSSSGNGRTPEAEAELESERAAAFSTEPADPDAYYPGREMDRAWLTETETGRAWLARRKTIAPDHHAALCTGMKIETEKEADDA